MPRYVVIIEKGKHNYGAYAPDVPGCVTTGRTFEETRARMEEALAFHLRGLAEDHDPIPEPVSEAVYVTVPEPEESPVPALDLHQLTEEDLWRRIEALKGKTIYTLVKGNPNVIEDVDQSHVSLRGRKSKISRRQIREGFNELKTSGSLVVQGERLRGSFSSSIVPALLRAALGRDQVETIPNAAGIRLKKTLAKAS